MRADLLTHPKVVRMSSALRADRLRVSGGLFAVWCLFDTHSVDGRLEGYTLEAVDDLIGFSGFGAAMQAVGWLEVDGDSLCTPRFEEHNGQSAKRRATESERKRNERKASASDADKKRTREEKRREETSSSLRSEDVAPTTAGEACKAMRAAGLHDANPQHPKMVALIAAGISVAELVDAAKVAVEKQKPFVYALSTAEGRRRDAAAVRALPAQPALNRQEAIEHRNREQADRWAADMEAKHAPN